MSAYIVSLGIYVTGRGVGVKFNILNSNIRKFTVATMTWLTTANDYRYVPFCLITIMSFPHSWFITGLVTRVTHVEHLCSPRFLLVWVEFAFVMLSNYNTFLVQCYNVRHDFRVKTMFDLPWSSFVLHRVPVLFMLFVFIYVSWCPNTFPYQIMSVLFNKKRRFSHMEQELPTLPEHMSAPWVLVRFVLFDL